MLNTERIEKEKALPGEQTVDMLVKVHDDALWILENLGVGCKQPELPAAFRQLEADGAAVIYEGRVYLSKDLVERCLESIRRIGLGTYMEDPLTTANLGKIFVN